MKTLLVVSVVMVAVVSGWESEPPKKYHGPLHYPVIHKGVPVETPEVQHAKAAHLEALSAAGHHQDNHYEADDHHNHEVHSHYKTEVKHVEHKYHGKLHYPKIYKGVPVDTPEVQHAREAHLSALAKANHGGSDEGSENHHHEPEHKYHGPLHYPKIYKGVPVDTPEVQHAREEHLSVVAQSSQHGHY